MVEIDFLEAVLGDLASHEVLEFEDIAVEGLQEDPGVVEPVLFVVVDLQVVLGFLFVLGPDVGAARVLACVLNALANEERTLIVFLVGDLFVHFLLQLVHINFDILVLLDPILDVLLGGSHSVQFHALQDPEETFH